MSFSVNGSRRTSNVDDSLSRLIARVGADDDDDDLEVSNTSLRDSELGDDGDDADLSTPAFSYLSSSRALASAPPMIPTTPAAKRQELLSRMRDLQLEEEVQVRQPPASSFKSTTVRPTATATTQAPAPAPATASTSATGRVSFSSASGSPKRRILTDPEETHAPSSSSSSSPHRSHVPSSPSHSANNQLGHPIHKTVSFTITERVIRVREGIQEFNPVYIFNPNAAGWTADGNRGEVAIHSIVGGSDGPTCGLMNFVRERRDTLAAYARSVCRLFLKRETPAGVETDVATALKVGPNRWLTVSHNMGRVFEIDCTSDLFAPRLAYRAISRYWVLSPISSPEHEPFQAEDIDPSTRWQWNTPSDFVFLKKADSEEDTVLFSNSTSVSQTALIDDYIVPDPTPLQEGEPICLIAYHHPPLPSYLHETYSQPAPTVTHIHEHFVAFELKAVSPGRVLKVGPGTFSHDCSTMHGAAGGLIFRLDAHGAVSGFCGIHLGSWKEKALNHSVALSVHHGSFVIEYVKSVLPYLIPTHAQMSESIQDYIRQHEQHLKNHSAEALRIYRQIIQNILFRGNNKSESSTDK